MIITHTNSSSRVGMIMPAHMVQDGEVFRWVGKIFMKNLVQRRGNREYYQGQNGQWECLIYKLWDDSYLANKDSILYADVEIIHDYLPY